MTIIPRKGRFGVRVSIDGERRWVGTFGTERLARIAEAQAVLDASLEKVEPVCCDSFADFFLEGYRDRTKESTYATAVHALAGFKADFAGRELGSVSGLEAEGWARNNRHRVQTVTTLYNDALRKGLVDRNPFRGLAAKGRGRKDMVPLTEKRVETLAQAAEGALGGYGHRFAALVRFAAYTGLRAGELFALEWRDLDFENRRLYVRRRVYDGRLDVPKTGEPERVLAPEARDAVIALPRDSEWVFTTKTGKRLSQSVLSWYWPSVWEKFGERVTLHELRHFAGWHMYVTLRLPSRVAAVQLGHDGPAEIERLYGHGNIGALEELDEAFGRRPAPVRAIRGTKGVADAG